MAIHRRAPAKTIIGAFADSACKRCSARIPVVSIEPSTRIKPTCTKRCRNVAEFRVVFMFNQTERLQKRHATCKLSNEPSSRAVP